MAPKASLTLEKLAALGLDRLAQLVLDAAESHAAVKKLVETAMAATKGPKAVAMLIDRRLAALERGKSQLASDKAKAFTIDLGLIQKAIVEELGPVDPSAAAQRLLRFIATHSSVYERTDDPQNRVEAVYNSAVAALQPLAAAMPEADRSGLPDMVMAELASQMYLFFLPAVEAVVGCLAGKARKAFDADLVRLLQQPPPHGSAWDYAHERRVQALIGARQLIAKAQGDIDGFVALEDSKPPDRQNPLATAAILLGAGRLPQALAWVRRDTGPPAYLTHADVADGLPGRDPVSLGRIGLEARILEAMGDRAAAQALRWACFEDTFDAAMLREHIAHLDDFDEFDVIDRAFGLVAASPAAYRALGFFIAWPQYERAARLVVERRAIWNGRRYELLMPAATALEDAWPVAASVLYRVLLDDILAGARSFAYGFAARYLVRLDALAAACDAASHGAIETHALYRANLMNLHGRKGEFWQVFARTQKPA